MPRRKDYELTPFMIDILKSFDEFLKTHPNSTTDVLAKYWGASLPTTSQRLTQLRRCGYKHAKLRRRNKNEYTPAKGIKRGTKELNIDGEIDNSEMIYDYYTVRFTEVGNPSLPICENCNILGRTTVNGEKPHYVMDTMDDGEEVMWCESCGHEPNAKKLVWDLSSINEQGSLRISNKIMR